MSSRSLRGVIPTGLREILSAPDSFISDCVKRLTFSFQIAVYPITPEKRNKLHSVFQTLDCFEWQAEHRSVRLNLHESSPMTHRFFTDRQVQTLIVTFIRCQTDSERKFVQTPQGYCSFSRVICSFWVYPVVHVVLNQISGCNLLFIDTFWEFCWLSPSILRPNHFQWAAEREWGWREWCVYLQGYSSSTTDHKHWDISRASVWVSKAEINHF